MSEKLQQMKQVIETYKRECFPTAKPIEIMSRGVDFHSQFTFLLGSDRRWTHPKDPNQAPRYKRYY